MSSNITLGRIQKDELAYKGADAQINEISKTSMIRCEPHRQKECTSTSIRSSSLFAVPTLVKLISRELEPICDISGGLKSILKPDYDWTSIEASRK